MGMIKQFKRLTLRVAGWYYDIHDFINDNGITAPGTGFGSNCIYNIDHVKLYGGEIEATITLGERFRATASYVHQQHKVTETGFEKDWTYYLPALLPKNKIKLLTRYMPWQDGWVELSSRYVDTRDAQKGTELDSYVTFDLGFEQTFRVGEVDYELKAYCGNIAGANYQEQTGYSMPRQVWGLQLGFKF